MNNTLARLATAILAVLTIAGCTLLSPVSNDTQKEVINQLPQTIPQHEPMGATLLVLPPQASPVYDTTRMAYTKQPYQVAYFSHHEWGAPPAQMLLPLLMATMENTRYFSAVVSPPYSGKYSYVLRTDLTELIQDFTTEPAAVQLSLRIQLSDGTTGRILGSREIVLREPMQQETPYAGVVKANAATAQALQQVAGFVLDTLK